LPLPSVATFCGDSDATFDRSITPKRNEPVIVEFIARTLNIGFRTPDLGARIDIFPAGELSPACTGQGRQFRIPLQVFCGESTKTWTALYT
jgi:hypothetical protein